MLVGAADVVFLYFLSLVLMLFYFVLKLLNPFRKADKYFKRKLESFKYGVFLELYEASFLFLLIATVINF